MASKRHLRRKSCERKKRFQNFEEANQAAKSHMRQFNAWMTAYPCKFGNHYHIGHPPRRIRQAINAVKER